MTTGGTPPGDGSYNNPYGDDPGRPPGDQGYGQQGREPYPDQGHGQPGYEPYPGQGYGQQGQDPYPGQGYEQSGHGQFGAAGYGTGQPQPGAPTGTVPSGDNLAMDSISEAWNLFKNNPLPWLLVAVVMGVFSSIMWLGSFVDSWFFYILGFLAFLGAFVLQAFIVRGALLEVDGHKPEIGDFVKLHNFGWYVVASIIVSVAVFIGTVLVVIPGLVLMFFLYWTLNFVIDRNMIATDAIMSSFNAIKSDGGNLLLLAFLNSVILFVGIATCTLGMLVALPLTTLSSTIAYRKITGPSDFSRAAAAGV